VQQRWLRDLHNDSGTASAQDRVLFLEASSITQLRLAPGGEAGRILQRLRRDPVDFTPFQNLFL
jgi:hypothetical protein